MVEHLGLVHGNSVWTRPATSIVRVKANSRPRLSLMSAVVVAHAGEVALADA